MRRLIFGLAVLGIGFACSLAQAQNPRVAGPVNRGPIAPYSKQAAIGAYGRAMYPRYRFGFHAREFENIGIPHGDIGTQSNSYTRNPW
jgi:hypothetical protein